MDIQTAINIINSETSRESLNKIRFEGYGGIKGYAATLKAVDDAVRVAVECMEWAKRMEDDGR